MKLYVGYYDYGTNQDFSSPSVVFDTEDKAQKWAEASPYGREYCELELNKIDN